MANDDLEALFARREEIDRSLQQHQRELSVMFTDIVGSTQYFEQRGDIAGMALLRRHNGMLFPVVQECSGRIIKTIGDAIMAVFDRPQDAVRCAQRMQRALEQEKRDAHQERIHIRIGAHVGRAFVTEKDVFGDTVNTAARVAHEAGGDEIVVSQQTAEALAASGGFRMQPRGSVSLKGKAEPLPLFLVSWRDAGGAEAPASALAPRRELPEMFSLELQRGPAGLKVAALDGDADKGTVKLYAESALSAAQLQEVSNRFSAFIGGGAAGSYKDRIREQGRALFDAALSDRARQKLQGSKLGFLRLELDDELVGVPWELMHDGQEFLCLRFAVGRMVAARDDASSSGRGAPRAGAGHALVVSNPSGDLPAANAEGEAVAGLLRDGFDGEVKHLRGPVTRQAFAAAVKGCSLLHFAGHSEVGAVGFVLADGHCSPQELVQAVGASAPVLVFANGCSASEGAGFTSAARGVTDVASALLRQGTQHYLGPMCAVGDGDALGFALRFYEAALGGAALGEAATEARRSLVQRATHPLAFAGYLLYGDPRRPFPGRVRLQRPQTRGPGPHTPAPLAPELATPAPDYHTPQPWSGPPTGPDATPTRAQRHRPPSVPRGQSFEPPSPTPANVFEPPPEPGAAPPLETPSSAFAPTHPSPGQPPSHPRAAPMAAGGPVMSHTQAVDGPPPRAPSAAPPKKRSVGLMVGAFAIIVGGSSGAWFATHRISVDPVQPGTGAATGSATGTATPTPTPPRPRTGDIRLTVLPFKNVSADKELDPLKEGLAEAVVTDFESRAGFKVIEHGLVGEEIEYIEFTQTKYVDPAAKAQLGKLKGAEVVVMGSYQRSGLVLRANARFVDSETGEILQSIKVEAPEIFALQDKLGAEARRLAPGVHDQLRPGGGK